MSANADIGPEFVFESPDGLVLRLQVRLYGFETVARAAHRFTDRCFVHLEHEDADHILCRFKAKRPGDDLSELAGEFANEALDQMLRAKLAAETEQTRLLLLAHAFSQTNILHPELDDPTPSSDPAQLGEDDASLARSDAP